MLSIVPLRIASLAGLEAYIGFAILQSCLVSLQFIVLGIC